MRPKNFMGFPCGSVSGKCESEIVAMNIMRILKRTGNKFRLLSWEEYKEERLKDADFSIKEKEHFMAVVEYCESPEKAVEFCSDWATEISFFQNAKDFFADVLKNLKTQLKWTPTP